MSKHDQVLCDYNGAGIYGGANCPFCGIRSELKGAGHTLLASQSCEHVSMAVSAGGLDVAIHFIGSGMGKLANAIDGIRSDLKEILEEPSDSEKYGINPDVDKWMD